MKGCSGIGGSLLALDEITFGTNWVAEAERRKCGLEDLPVDAMRAVEPRITKSVYDVLGVENSVRSRVSFGGTAPERVAEQIAWWRARL